MSILTESGRIAIAEAIKEKPIHLAWGPGDGSWTVPPAEDVNATGLITELGRRLSTSVAFVVPDEDGTIEIPGEGFFTETLTPTKRLLITTQFAYSEEVAATIRQIAVFVGTEVIAGLPAGQRYFTPAQVQSPGRMLQLQNLDVPVVRSAATRSRFENLIVF